MIIEIKNLKCPTWNSFLYRHWRIGHKAKQEVEELVYWEAQEQAKGKSFQKARVTIRAFFKGKGRHDPDNLFVKPIMDGLVKAGVFPDDNGDIVESLTLEAKNRCDDDFIRISIEKL